MAERSPEDLVGRLRTLADSATEEHTRAQASLSEASANLRVVASALPELLRPALQQLATDLRESLELSVAQARQDLAAAVARAQASTEAAHEASGTRTLEHLAEVRAGVRHLETTLTQRTEALAEESIRLTEASELSSTEASAAHQAVVSLLERTRAAAAGLEEASVEFLQRVERTADEVVATTRVQVESLCTELGDRLRASEREATARLEDSARSLHADLLVGVSDLRDRLREVLDERDHRDELLEKRLAARVERLTTKTVERVMAVTSDVTDRLAEVVQHRDHADALLEKRLEARVERLTKRTADKITELAGALDDRLAELRVRESADREHLTSALRDVVDRVLTEPRGALRGLRKNLRDD